LKKIIDFLKYANIIVVAVTGIAAVAFYKLPTGNENIDWKVVGLLSIITWAIYVFDRLLDNQKELNLESERHLYHEKYKFNFIFGLIGLLLIIICMLFFQEPEIIRFGIFLGLFLLLYFVLTYYFKKFSFFKEIFMPILYVSAVVGVSFASKSSINLSQWILGFIFLLVCLQNILLISYLEYHKNDQSVNICQKINPLKIRKVIIYAGSINLFLVIFFFSDSFLYTQKLAWTLAFISSMYAITPIFKDKLLKSNNYRIWLDLVLFFLVFVF
jgi:4-hydroxybenzoate polyprenyltransferase